MNRIIIINKTHSPSREELVTTERQRGELLMTRLVGAQWAGYVGVESTGKLAASWTIPSDQVEAAIELAQELRSSPILEVRVHGPGSTPPGGQCEIRLA